MAKKWYNGKIVKIVDETPTTKRFWVEVPEKLPFVAGQFITMDLPISEKRLKRWRSYSIANAPDESGLLEFCIVLLEGGAATTYLFEEAEVGTSIRFKGPLGVFVLPKEVEKDLVMICTGTGIAPFRSMLIDLYQQKKSYRNIHLIFGTRYFENLLYRQDLEELAQKMPRFKFSVALSREEEISGAPTGWDMHKGYVHPVYEKYYADVRSDIVFYLCGWSNMIDEAVEKLSAGMGYDKSQIRYELYG